MLLNKLENVRRNLYRTSVLKNDYLKQKPGDNEKQTEFLYYVDKKEGFYGGAAGGGKSSALLMEALRFVDVENYAALLLRRTYPQLAMPEALLDRAKEWLTVTEAKWSEKTKTWTFPSGATLSFGYLQYEGDKYQYQSAAFQFIGFDELTQFTESQYTYLFSRLRKLEDVKIPLRMRSASNPGNIGHEWVKQRFITPSKEELAEHGRFFVPALLEDNPYLDRLSYEENLKELDTVTYEQLRHGNWDIAIRGELFNRTMFDLIEKADIRKESNRVRYWDLAATEAKEGADPDYTVGALMIETNGIYDVADIRRVRKHPSEVEALVKHTAAMDGVKTDIYMEEEPGSAGKSLINHYARNVLRGYNFRGHKETGSKPLRARPFAAAAANHLVRVVNAPWTNDMLSELEVFPTPSVHDDIVDALSGAYSVLSSRSRLDAHKLAGMLVASGAEH